MKQSYSISLFRLFPNSGAMDLSKAGELGYFKVYDAIKNFFKPKLN